MASRTRRSATSPTRSTLSTPTSTTGPSTSAISGSSRGAGRPVTDPRALAKLLEGASRIVLREPVSAAPNAPKAPTDPTAPVEPRPSPPASEEVGRYQLIGEIARGGMGVVMRGHDTELGRDVAMKILREEFVDRDE